MLLFAAAASMLLASQAQRREVKRLRGQLIKTREEYASALARIDELEAFEEFRESQIHPGETAADVNQAASPRSSHSGGGPHFNAESPGAPQGSSGAPPDEWQAPASRQHPRETQADEGPERSSCDCDAASTAGFLGGRRSEGAGENLLGHTGTSSGSQAHADSLRGPGLGKSVTGLLASGVSQLLQRIEHTISADRDPPELSTDPESQASADSTPPEEERGLHEEAALFLQRTSGTSSDLIVHLEGQQQSEPEGGEEEVLSPSAADSRSLGNVARSMWQAAHELLADRALPPARLSTLRTVAAGNPSAWEVLRERHRAAKSMPLFSSIPPAAYPLIAQARDQQPSGRQGTVASGSTRTAALASRRRSNPVAAGAGARTNARPLGRVERGRREGTPHGCMTVELPSELPPCTSDAPSSDVGEAEERRSERREMKAPLPADETDAQNPTATEQGTAAAAAEPKIPQTTSASDGPEQPVGISDCRDTPEAEPEHAGVHSEVADAAAEGEPLQESGV